MSWDVVRQELLSLVVIEMTIAKQADGRRWVDLLGQSVDGKRLGACIIIDIRHGALSASTFASILDHLDFSKQGSQKSGCWAFHDALQNHPAHLANPTDCPFVCASSFSLSYSESSDEEYVRVLDLSDFIVYVLDSNDHPFSALAQDDRDRARRMYFEGFDSFWEAIEKMWTGGMGRVFVTSSKDLLELLSEDNDDPGRNVNDGLGLGMTGNLEFVAVQYAPTLKLTVHQPTTLDGNWSSRNWYVSHKGGDHWGRTHRCSGIGSQARERVHKGLPVIEEGFSGRYIGAPKRPLAEDRDKLLEDAFDRM